MNSSSNRNLIFSFNIIPAQTNEIGQELTKAPDQIAVEATDSPPEPAGEGALPAELTELSLEALMALQVSRYAHRDPEDPGAIDGLQPTGTLTDALPIDLTELDLADLMNFGVTGEADSDSNEPKVAGLLRNEDLSEDLTKLGLAELMTLGVRAGVYEDLPEDLLEALLQIIHRLRPLA